MTTRLVTFQRPGEAARPGALLGEDAILDLATLGFADMQAVVEAGAEIARIEVLVDKRLVLSRPLVAGEAVAKGGVDEVLPLKSIAKRVVSLFPAK